MPPDSGHVQIINGNWEKLGRNRSCRLSLTNAISKASGLGLQRYWLQEKLGLLNKMFTSRQYASLSTNPSRWREAWCGQYAILPSWPRYSSLLRGWRFGVGSCCLVTVGFTQARSIAAASALRDDRLFKAESIVAALPSQMFRTWPCASQHLPTWKITSCSEKFRAWRGYDANVCQPDVPRSSQCVGNRLRSPRLFSGYSISRGKQLRENESPSVQQTRTTASPSPCSELVHLNTLSHARLGMRGNSKPGSMLLTCLHCLQCLA